VPKIGILWDEEAIEHIRRHGVRRYEVEKALNGKTYTKTVTRNGEKRTSVLAELEGRVLFIVLQKLKRNIFRVISAYEAPEKMKKLYKRKVKK
jgi:uncharacterized DUF497 family protein